MADEPARRSLFWRVLDFVGPKSAEPIGLGLPAPPARPVPVRPPAPAPTLVPGNFLFFDLFLGIKVGENQYFCPPMQAIRNSITGEIVWGTPLEFVLYDPQKPHIEWTDDPANGINSRQLINVEDALGAEGNIQGRHYRFEKVLFLGRNQVVYALFNRDSQSRMAYGFDRNVFSPGETPSPSQRTD
jgi:hypothetical protein